MGACVRSVLFCFVLLWSSSRDSWVTYALLGFDRILEFRGEACCREARSAAVARPNFVRDLVYGHTFLASESLLLSFTKSSNRSRRGSMHQGANRENIQQLF